MLVWVKTRFMIPHISNANNIVARDIHSLHFYFAIYTVFVHIVYCAVICARGLHIGLIF